MPIPPIAIPDQPSERGGDLPLLVSFAADRQRAGDPQSDTPRPDEIRKVEEGLDFVSKQWNRGHVTHL
jgi:hypothetical protein